MPLLALLLAAAAPPLPAQLNDPTTTEGWIWQEVQAGRTANLNKRCGTEPLDIHKRDDARWQAPCRRIDPVLLRALLTQPDLAELAPRGVGIFGGRIEGNLDFYGVHVRSSQVWLNGSWISGVVDLTNARLDGLLALQSTLIKAFNGERVLIGSELFMRRTEFGGPVLLADAQVEGQMSLDGAKVAAGQTFDAVRLHVGAGGLFLRNMTFGGSVLLLDARVDGQMNLDGAKVAAAQTFDAQRLHVGAGGLFLSNMTFGGPVVLRDAQIEGQMDMDRATVAAGQTFEAQRLHVGGIFSRLATFGGASIFQDLRVDASMDLQGSHVRRLDLAGTIIRGDLRFAERYPYGSESWLSWDDCDGSTSCLNLRNTRVENLQDDERAWPARITLEGFTYTHLGGIGDDQRLDMRNRLIDWWRDWLNRDPVYSAQPYAQLASVLAVAGNRDGAADIRFFGRDRERTELLRGCRWLQKLGWVAPPNDDRPCKWLSGVGLSAQQTFIGYGIGGYSFRAVWSALALVFVGMVLLFFAPGVRRVEWDYSGPGSGPRQKSALWCIGASLHRVLPLITISQEFSDFFNDPKRERLRPWQHAAFAVLALLGWVLAAFVAAAFSGLIQS